MASQNFRTALRFVGYVVLGIVVLTIGGAYFGSSPVRTPSAAQCRDLSEANAALTLCLKVQGCYVTPADIRAAMRDGREKQAVGCPE